MKLTRIIACLLLMMMLAACASAGEEEITVPPFADFSEKFGDLFLEEGEEIIQEELIYRSQDIYIEITPMRRLASVA